MRSGTRHAGARLVGALMVAATLAGGCDAFGRNRPGGDAYRLSPALPTQAQACAIGYDMARQIHDRVSLRRTVIIAPRRKNRCERHAIEYLQLAGFRIANRRSRGEELQIKIQRVSHDRISVVAEIGSGLRIARDYRPVRTGVIPLTAVAIQHLAPDTYATRRRG